MEEGKVCELVHLLVMTELTAAKLYDCFFVSPFSSTQVQNNMHAWQQ